MEQFKQCVKKSFGLLRIQWQESFSLRNRIVAAASTITDGEIVSQKDRTGQVIHNYRYMKRLFTIQRGKQAYTDRGREDVSAQPCVDSSSWAKLATAASIWKTFSCSRTAVATVSKAVVGTMPSLGYSFSLLVKPTQPF